MDLKHIDLDILKEKLIQNKLYVAVWMVTLLSILFVNWSTSSTYKFVGETDSKEVIINSRNAVVIKGINVIPGQYVKKGQLLIELDRKDLAHKINEVSAKLEELNAQYKLNSELNADIRSIRKSKRRSKIAKDVKVDDVLSIQIRNLEKELKLLNKEQENLYIFSKFDGHIGFVNFKIGESVSPFTPILTMHKKTPSFVRGYIHENLSNQVAVNKKVMITSLSSKLKVVAKVKNIGTRIVEFPERFRRTPEIKVWGREVMIEIPENNAFLLGEKVFITVDDDEKLTFLNRSVADDEISQTVPYNLVEIKRGDLTDNQIEPSGLLYIKDLNKYMMVSDDNLENKPLVYLLNPDGRIDPLVVNIEGVDEIKDMESITMDENGLIYIASSMSPSRSGKISSHRRKLIRMNRKGINLKKTGEVYLFTLLNKLAKKNKKSSWVRLLKAPKKSKFNIELDVEGMVVQNNEVLLGLRNPVGNKKEVAIIRIKDIDKVFDNNEILGHQVSVFRMISLPLSRQTDRHEGISDLLVKGDDLYIVTANNKNNNVGRVLKTKIDAKNAPVTEIKHFSKHRPEGIAYNTEKDEFVVVFDNNDEKAKLVMSVIKQLEE